MPSFPVLLNPAASLQWVNFIFRLLFCNPTCHPILVSVVFLVSAWYPPLFFYLSAALLDSIPCHTFKLKE